MRICGGFYRSRIIEMVNSDETRETTDKVRMAIFNLIGQYISGVSLDLFGGSGAMGLESISRGIEKCYINDIGTTQIKTINKNIKTLKCDDKVIVSQSDYKEFLIKNKDKKFDYIFLDPPYALKVCPDIILFIDENDMLNQYGMIVVEYPVEDDKMYPNVIGKYQKIKDKKYGIRKIAVYEY